MSPYLRYLIKVAENQRVIAPRTDWWLASLNEEWERTATTWKWDDCLNPAWNGLYATAEREGLKNEGIC